MGIDASADRQHPHASAYHGLASLARPSETETRGGSLADQVIWATGPVAPIVFPFALR